MIVFPAGALFLGLFVMALPYLIGGVIGAILSPFYWAYRLIHYLIGVVFRIARGLYMLTRFMFRVGYKLSLFLGKLGGFMQAQHHRRTEAAPSNVVAFTRYRALK
jgi:hypothetical protein